MLYLILFVLISAIFFAIINQILIRKYYWGPSGKPPRDDSYRETPPNKGQSEQDDSAPKET